MGFCFSLQELQNFHSIDRELYARLVVGLGLDPNQFKKIVAFWNWLEVNGYHSFVRHMLLLPDALLCSFANEAITCLNCLKNGSCLSPYVDDHNNVPLMRCLVSEDFSLKFVYENRKSATYRIEKFMKDVCERVFSDIVPPNLAKEAQSLVPGDGFEAKLANRHSGCVSQNGQAENEAQSLVPGDGFEPKLANEHSGCVAQNGQAENETQGLPSLPQENRTLFVTFSKGFPLSKEELKDLITRKFGNCVEAIYMKVQPSTRPLYACVVVQSPSAIAEILGEKDLVKFFINGKHVWVRRFVQKMNQMTSTSRLLA